jgi:predicted acylesterase/phospholipase RssA
MGDGVVREELRFAVVLNGGVSLAIWMGGAVHELDRLTRGSGEYYEQLLAWVMSSARVDVISGTSAGGINGAALALSQCNGSDDAGSLHQLRDVWLESGRLQSLMRPPFRVATPSLLQGDEFFLPQMNQALRRLVTFYEAKPVETHPIDLTITATLLRGIPGVVVDHAGQRVGQTRHDGLFRFRRGPTHPAAGTAAGDDFSATKISQPGGVIDALALAARTTASYPMAFEPSFLPVSDVAAPAGVPPRPVVETYLSGAWDQSQEQIKRARYAVDGGVLANTPTRPAMEAIDAMPASGPVRRVMLLIHPHAPPIITDSDDDATKPPSLVATGSSLLKAITSEGSRNFADLIEQHNRVARGQRSMRADVVGQLPPTPDAPVELREQARCVYGLYRRRRLRAAAHHLASLWVGRTRSLADAAERATRPSTSTRSGSFRSETVASVEPEVLELLEAFTQIRSPAKPTAAASSTSGPAGPIWPFLPPEVDGLPAPGQLGFDGALGIADAAADYLRRAIWWASLNDSDRDLVDVICSARDQASKERNRILARRREFDTRLAELAADRGEDELKAWVNAAVYQHGRLCNRLADPLEKIEDAVSQARLRRADIQDPAQQDRAAKDDNRTLRDFTVALSVADDPHARGAVLERLSFVAILTYTLSCERTTGNQLPIDLIQLTYQVEHPFADNLMGGEAKVAGDLIGRFGGFLKRSWRLNDWTWGRLDAARVLCQTVLEPQRVHRYLRHRESHGVTPAQLATELLTSISEDPGIRTRMQLPSQEALAAELLALLDGGGQGQLELLPSVFATAIALEIAAEELPELPSAVERDLEEGAGARSKGTLSVRADAELLTAAGDGTDRRAGWIGLERFAASGLGQESLVEEASSDQMVMTATTAAATAISMLDDERSGLGKLKPLTRTLRGAALLPYWTMNGLTGGNALARSLAQLTMALGAVLVVLGLLGAAPVWVTSAGVGMVLIAFAYAALRSGTVLHGVVLLIPALIVLVLGPPGPGDTGEEPAPEQVSEEVVLGEESRPAEATTREVRQAGSTTVVVAAVALVGGLFVLGSLSPPVASPVTWWRGGQDRRRTVIRRLSRWFVASSAARKAGVLLLALLIVAGPAVAFVPRLRQEVGGWLSDLPPPVWDVLAIMVPGAAVVIGILLAVATGRDATVLDLLPGATPDTRELRRRESPSSDPATAGWSVVYGLIAAGLALATWQWTIGTPTWAVPSSFGLGALLLVVAVPWCLHHRVAATLQRGAQDAFRQAALPQEASDTAKIATLFASNLNVRYLLRPAPEGDEAPTPGFALVELTGGANRAFLLSQHTDKPAV